MNGSASSFLNALDSLAGRRVVLFGGKGGVGKTTIAVAAALHYAGTRKTILFTTDPASNLHDLFGEGRPANLTIEQLDAAALYDRFLQQNLESFLEIGDRGTYLDRDELRRFFELSLPGIDEIMAWMRIGELAEANADSIVVVDTAPTGHTIRMLAAAGHFREFASALDSMQQKHRAIVQQLTRRNSRDAIDDFIDRFDDDAKRRSALLTESGAFVPVMLSEPWVVEQTLRLIEEVRADRIEVPFVILNRAVAGADCARCRERKTADDEARNRVAPMQVVDATRACVPIGSADAIEKWMRGATAVSVAGELGRAGETGGVPLRLRGRLLFFAGKGGVGKTTSATSVALQLAAAHTDRRYVIISVDPAHALRDVFANEQPPSNLAVEIIDTRAKWLRFRETLGTEIERAISGLTPSGLTVAYDTEALQKLIEVAPPGADELFAISRLADLLADDSVDRIIVDTAPTGHFLRLIELPRSAGEWIREFMRILLRYRELITAGSLGEELVNASRSLKTLDESLHGGEASVVVVTRPERIVVAETARLREELERRGIGESGVIANYVTPPSECRCDSSMRSHELEMLRALGGGVTIVERREAPVTRLADLARLVALASD